MEAPIVCPTVDVQKDWIDYNGHMNMAFYHWVFDRGVDHVFDYLGVGAEYVANGGGSCFTAEVHVAYLAEVALGDPLKVTWQLLDYDAKRLHYFEHMYHATEGYLAATSEQISIHVDMQTRRSAPMPEKVLGLLKEMHTTHAGLATPEQVGSVIRIRR